MGLFDAFKRKRAVSRAFDRVKAGEFDAGMNELLGLGQSRADALVELAERLLDGGDSTGAYTLAKRAIEDVPAHWNARVVLGEIAVELEDFDEAIGIYRSLHAEKPSPVTLRALAKLLVDKHPEEAVKLLEPHADAADLRIPVLLARAYVACGRLKDALPLTTRAMDFFAAERKKGWSGAYHHEEATEIGHLHDGIVSHLHGREEVVGDHARRGMLDGRAGVNFKLLAAKLMVKSDRIAPRLELSSVDELEALAKTLNGAPALVQRATAKLRRGDEGAAISLFDEARDLDPSHFGAMYGLGAALSAQQKNHLSQLKRLPKVGSLPPLLEKVVPDWPKLTELERRVVLASVNPLRGALHSLVEEEVTIRLLPVDVRPVDLPELAELLGKRVGDDQRSYAALHGLAGRNLAVASIVDLLDVSPAPAGWVFAHEFAHLAEGAISDENLAKLDELFSRARKHEWVWTEYQLRNLHEFFAVAYVDYLLVKYGLDLGREVDSEGEMQRVFDFIAKLGN